MKSALTRISLYSETSTAVYKSGRVGKMSRGQLELGQLDGRVKALTRRVKFRPAASFSACLLARTIRADLCNPHGSAEEVCLLREVKGGLECAAARLAVFYLSTHLAPFSILPRAAGHAFVAWWPHVALHMVRQHERKRHRICDQRR